MFIVAGSFISVNDSQLNNVKMHTILNYMKEINDIFNTIKEARNKLII